MPNLMKESVEEKMFSQSLRGIKKRGWYQNQNYAATKPLKTCSFQVGIVIKLKWATYRMKC